MLPLAKRREPPVRRRRHPGTLAAPARATPAAVKGARTKPDMMTVEARAAIDRSRRLLDETRSLIQPSSSPETPGSTETEG